MAITFKRYSFEVMSFRSFAWIRCLFVLKTVVDNKNKFDECVNKELYGRSIK